MAAAVAASLLAAAGTASAAEPGWYLAADVGMNSFRGSKANLDSLLVDAFDGQGQSVDALSSSVDRSATGFEFAVGYQVTERVAFEAAYIDLGKTSYAASGTVDGGEGFTIDAHVKSRGPALSFIGSMPLSDSFSLDARLGALFGKNKISAGGTIDFGTIPSVSGSDSKTGTLVGVGATWTVSSRIGVRIGYTRFNNVVHTTDVNQYRLGLKVSF